MDRMARAEFVGMMSRQAALIASHDQRIHQSHIGQFFGSSLSPVLLGQAGWITEEFLVS